MRCQTLGTLTDCFARVVIQPFIKALERGVKKAGHSGYKHALPLPRFPNALLRPFGENHPI
jgi:hypothetical protein